MFFERLAYQAVITQDFVNHAYQVFHYYDSCKVSKRILDVKYLMRDYYKIRTSIMANKGVKLKASSKKFTKTHWASLDVRSKEEQQNVISWLEEPDRHVEALVVACEAQATISVKPQDGGTCVAYLFLPVVHDEFDTIGIRASGRDGHLALAVLLYKYYVMFTEYELPEESDEDMMFS